MRNLKNSSLFKVSIVPVLRSSFFSQLFAQLDARAICLFLHFIADIVLFDLLREILLDVTCHISIILAICILSVMLPFHCSIILVQLTIFLIFFAQIWKSLTKNINKQIHCRNMSRRFWLSILCITYSYIFSATSAATFEMRKECFCL